MELVTGRDLTDEDVATAHALIDQHQPGSANLGPDLCSSATHLITAPTWPCQRYVWARRVLEAEDRGEVPGAASNVHHLHWATA